MFRDICKFDNFYLNCCIEANQVNFSQFSRFKLHTPDGHYSVPPNVDLCTMEKKLKISTGKQKLDSSEAYNDGEWQEIRCT